MIRDFPRGGKLKHRARHVIQLLLKSFYDMQKWPFIEGYRAVCYCRMKSNRMTIQVKAKEQCFLVVPFISFLSDTVVQTFKPVDETPKRLPAFGGLVCAAHFVDTVCFE